MSVRNGAIAARRGFTLVEMVLVIAIIGIVAAIALPAFQSYIERGRRAQAIMDLQEISDAIRKLDKTTGLLPASLAAAGFGARVDPWNRPYQYLNLRTGEGNGISRKDKKLAPLNSDFDLYTVGPDGLTNSSLLHASSRDDIVRARDGGFIGTAEEFDP
jgi:general secretion pathway protein G